MMKYIVPFFLINLFAFTSKAQTSTVAKNNIIPPSPTAAALAKYAEWPVSLYTGTPQINIPLYDLSSQKTTVPISLSYHASGIKVDEDASWVGLAWSLNAGGVITRTVRGLPDDKPTFGYYDARNYLPDPSKGYDNTTNFNYFDQEAAGVIDTQPDVFMFNAQGRSFKFFIDSDLHVQTIPKSAVKINFPHSSSTAFTDNDQWVVQLEDGTTLYFGGAGAVERTDNAYANADDYYTGTGFVSSWYLKRIVPAVGQEINLTYTPETIHTQLSISMTDFLAPAPTPARGLERNLSQPVIYGARLNGIQTADQLVKFVAHPSVRTDLSGGYALDSIKVYALPARKLIKQYSLNYIYPASNRLRLDHITEYATDNSSQINQWSFSYNATNLPARASSSYAQDHWGYYNGASNATLLPAVDGFNNSSIEVGDREAHYPYSSAEVLSQINYPTGGYSQFNYEAQAYLDSTALTSPTAISATALLNTSDPMGTVKSTALTINPSQYISLDYTVTRDPNATDPYYVKVTLTNSAGGVTFSRLKAVNGTFHESISVAAGNYILSIVSPDMDNTYCTATISWYPPPTNHIINRIVGGVRVNNIIDYDGKNLVNKRTFIYNNAFCAAPIKNTDYIYYPLKIYDIHPCAPGNDGSPSVNQINVYTARTSYSKAAVGSTGGSHIGYGDVTILYGDNGSNGKEQDIFSNGPADVIARGFPFPPATSYDYMRGQLLTQKIFDSGGLPKKVTNYTYNYVSRYILGAFAVGFLLDNPCYDGISGLGVPNRDQITYTTFGTVTDWVQKASQQEDVYDNGGNKVTTLNTYYYDNAVHMQPTRTVTTKSYGKIITAVTTYPDDYTSGTPFIDDMKTAHLTGLPIEQVSYLNDGTNNSILSGTITQYQTGGKGLVDMVYKLESATPVPGTAFKYSNRATGSLPYGTVTGAYSADSHYVKRMTYNQYDGLGNLLMLTPEGAPAIAYQWGYNSQYPVAQATNAKRNDIFFDSFEEGNGNSTLNDSKTGHYSHTGSYSKALTGLDAGTYVLSYWQKSGAAWSLITTSVTITGSIYTISLNTQIDDVRFYPLNSQVTTYTYDPLVGMTSSTDAKGITTSYEYDSFQRLKDVKDKNGNVIKHMDYHYQGQ